MNKTIIRQILIIFLIMIVGIVPNFSKVYAETASVSVSASSIKPGESFTVTLNIPSNAVGGQCSLTVSFPDGTKQSDTIIFTTASELGGNGGSKSVSFTAPNTEGTITVSATNIEYTVGNDSVSVDSISKTITVANPTPTPTPADTTPVNNTQSQTTPKNTSTDKTNNTVNNTNTNTNTNTTITQKVTFTDKSGAMYATKNCNLRAEPSTSSELVGSLTKGEEVTLTGIGSNGWYRIKYGGKTVYVGAGLLTDETPDENEIEENNTVNNTNTNTTDELKSLQNTIGVLPNVGNNVFDFIYYVAAIISVVGVIYCIYYINKKDVE